VQTHVVILGAGFGGLELASRLSEAVPDHAKVTLIDKSDSFVFGFSKLDVMFGRQQMDEVRIPYRDIAKPGVDFRQETITSIDPEARRVVTDGGTYDADILVVALGADYAPEATPGLLDDGYEFYSIAGAVRAGEALAQFPGGRVVVSVLGPLFKCPGAPNETALMVNDLLVRRGLRDASTIHLVTPMPMPIPISRKTSDAIIAILEDHGVEYWPGSLVTHLDPDAHVAHLADGRELPYDLFLGIPVHCAPPVVAASALVEDGWIPVDPATFATRFPGVYAVGDVTSAPVPRAGGIAEGEAATVAEVLIAQLTGRPAPPPYDGASACYVELGSELVGRIDVNFLTYDVPVAKFTAPATELTEEKRQWGAERRARWFGSSVS
jgi:sulfide:quinone oxidoreductase